ncbi:MAG: polyphosphate polymerase domain-containing protein [candidate division WOR-3 bacterium]
MPLSPNALILSRFAITPGRLEYKFLVPVEQLNEMRKAMKPYVCLDSFCEKQPNHQYTVRSIYYDNRRFDCYYEKFDGFQFKKKLRIRGYNEEDRENTAFLEIKYKNGDFIGKHRAPVKWHQIKDVFASYIRTTPLPLLPPESSPDDALLRFMFHYYRRKMLPVAIIVYEREAFYSRFDSRLRLTIDKNVRSRLYPALDSLYIDRGMKFVMPEQFVFEVKFYGALPRWVQWLLTRFDLQRLAVSKYALGIEAHRMPKKFLLGIGHADFEQDLNLTNLKTDLMTCPTLKKGKER